MNKRILKNGLTGLLCVVLLLTNILSVEMEVTATELDSTILNTVENINGDNDEDTEEIIENDGQEEDSNLEESDDRGSQSDDNNQENSDSENENKDEEIENKKNEEIDNSEDESEEIEDDIDEASNEDDEIIEGSEELNEEAEIATVATEGEETLSEFSGQCGDNLTWMLEDGTLTISGTGNMYDYSMEYITDDGWLSTAPWGKYYNEIERIVLCEGILSVGNCAFEGYAGSETLLIPNTVTLIGERAFYNCAGFTGKLIIPESVTVIEERAFYGCSGFDENLIIGDNVTTIKEYAFRGCSGFTGSLIIPNSVTILEDCAFNGCSGFNGNLTISNSISVIDYSVFSGCSGFTGSLEIPNNITEIDTSAFEGCVGFNGNLVIPDSVTYIRGNAFKGCCGFSGNLVISENATVISWTAFEDCSNLKNIVFRGLTLSISDSAFKNIVANIYYPSWKSGWDSVVDNDYGGTLTWIPYAEGTSPWENGSAEGTTNFWFVVNTDASDLAYNDAAGYNKKQFNLNISLTHLEMEIDPESYEDVNMIIELPEGLSFSQDEEIRTKTSVLGTIDKTNNKQDVSHLVYITGNNKVDKFTVTVKVTAKGYETSQIYIYDIPVSIKKVDYIVSSLPECGYKYCGLKLPIYCTIQFNKNIKKCNEGYKISLIEYNSENVIEEHDLSDEAWVYANGDTLFVMFEEKLVLSANTKYAILIPDGAIEFEDGTLSLGMSNKEGWNFTTAALEYSLKSNPEKKISLEVYTKIYKPLYASVLSLLHNGKGGTCFGIAYAAGAWAGRYNAINLISDGNTLKNLELDTKGNFSYTFLEYIQLAYLYQFSSVMQIELRESTNKYDELYEAIKEYQNGVGAPILLAVRNYIGGGHAIVPLGILSENENFARVAVYDCNGGHKPYSFLNELVLKKDNGKFVGYEYSKYNGYIQYYVMDETIDNVIYNSSYEEKSNLIFSDTEINDLDEIVVCADDVEAKVESHLYWTDDNAIFRAASSNTELSKIGITDGYKEISVDMPLNADVTLNLDRNTAQASFAGMSDYSVTYSKAIDDDIHSITVNGKASGSLLAEQTTEGVVLKADSLKDITVEVKNNDATASKKTFSSEKNSVLVKEENNDIIIYEDSNGDGIYDKRIDPEIEDVTSAYAVAVTVQRDNKIWNEHGRKFALTTDSGATFVSSLDKVPEGNYVVYDVTGIDEGFFGASGVNTGVSVAVKDGDADVTVDFYTVTFYDQDIAYGGETFQRPQIILKGKKALVPTLNPTKSGYSFGGWVTTDEGSQTFNFDTSIVGTTNIYASWMQDESVGYTITASAGEGGSITPNGSVHVNEGENQTFTITPDSGYRLKSIVVDGKEEAADEEKTRDSSAQQGSIRHYTFSDVRVNHIIRVVFEADSGNTGGSGNAGGNTGNDGNTGDNTGDSGNSGNTGGNTGDSGNSGNTGGNTGDSGNSGNTGGSTGDSGSGENTGGNGSSSGNNGNTNSSGSNTGDNSGNNADGGGNTNAADNANNSHFSNSGAGNTMNTGNGTGNSDGNNKSNGVSSSASGNNGINSKSGSSKDTEPKTEDVSHIEIYATIAMITGLLYLVFYFADEGGITEEEKNEMVAALVKWAKQGTWVRRYTALILIFFLLAYYHSIGKRTSVEWKAVYEK